MVGAVFDRYMYLLYAKYLAVPLARMVVSKGGRAGPRRCAIPEGLRP